ncbi:probable malonyl-CoA-acyl carrier protein transacylase, mitochondrial [Bacillus rossius redtenbacheri]|uniref:probable malonyl-CoA-acyl carrier protein transacylase, mitochondrial n=1 Tax=Bacillus rossius redtenbacheri TaxID=93214 RepID=UPI002FDEA077
MLRGCRRLCELCRPRLARWSHGEGGGSRADDVKKLLDSAAVGVELDARSEWATLPYPEGALPPRDQSLLSARPKVDPRETSILLFPGQGTQFVGMGKELVNFPVARDMFEVASEILGYDLLKLCAEGPQRELDRTERCQPAVLVCSLAAVERLKEERPAAVHNCVATAGYSVGELAALVFAGALHFEAAVRLVKVRAEAMQLASDLAPGGMTTVMYGPDSQLGHACLRAREWCKERGIEKPECAVASYLYPHCKVVAGHVEALKFIEGNLAQFKLRRAKRLPVSGAFHTGLMGPAVPAFAQALRRVALGDPLVPVHSNVDGRRYRDAAHVRRQLPRQLCRPVRWEQTLHALYERAEGQHFPRSFECGPGRSLKAILKMVNAKAWDSCVSVEA